MVAPQKKKYTGLFSTKTVDRSPQELFILAQISNVSHGTIVTNDLYLNLELKFETSACCVSQPSIKIPLTVIPMTYQEDYGLKEPKDFNPKELGRFKLELMHIKS